MFFYGIFWFLVSVFGWRSSFYVALWNFLHLQWVAHQLVVLQCLTYGYTFTYILFSRDAYRQVLQNNHFQQKSTWIMQPETQIFPVLHLMRLALGWWFACLVFKSATHFSENSIHHQSASTSPWFGLANKLWYIIAEKNNNKFTSFIACWRAVLGFSQPEREKDLPLIGGFTLGWGMVKRIPAQNEL